MIRFEGSLVRVLANLGGKSVDSLQQMTASVLNMPGSSDVVSVGLISVPVLAFCEALLGLGLFVSGILLVGTCLLLVNSDPGLLPQILVLAFAGALSSDLLGYGIGYIFSERVMQTQLMSRYGDAKDRFRSLVDRSMLLAICTGRLTPMLRSLTPFLAGSLGVRPARFVIFDLIACSIWVTGLATILTILPGAIDQL
jgi:membrane protein DedA with SNARE-associated domain